MSVDSQDGAASKTLPPVERARTNGHRTETEESPLLLFPYGTVGPEREGLPLDVVYDILKNKRRRFVLLYLESVEGSVTIGELAERIAAYENDLPVEGLNAQQRKRVYIGLYQCHLPKMADAGLIEFNQNRGKVELEEHGADLIDFMRASIEQPPNRSRYYHGVVGSGVAVFLASLAVPGPTWLSTVAVLLLVFGVLFFTFYPLDPTQID